MGAHTITASVTDSGGRPGSASRTLTVTSITPTTVTFNSVASQDGRIWESGENTSVGGGGNSTDNTTTALRVGDTDVDEQYKNIVSFDTSSHPGRRHDPVGDPAPGARHPLGHQPLHHPRPLRRRHRRPAASAAPRPSPSPTGRRRPPPPAWSPCRARPANGSASTGSLSAAGLAAISKTGTTQLRVYCTLGDNDDLGFDYIGFYPGETPPWRTVRSSP